MSDTNPLEAERARSRDLRSLAALWPFVSAYNGQLSVVLVMLSIAAAATLVVPMALRDIVDHGFSNDDISYIDRVFQLFLIVALVLALSSACRFFFVMRLGERVIADVRMAVYNHVITLSAYFFERTRTGEIVSRLTTDTTLIQSIVGASASIALRNVVMLVGALLMLVWTSPKLSALFVVAAPIIIFPLIIFGRRVRGLSRQAQGHVASTSALASESLNAVQTVQAFAQEDRERHRFAAAVEQTFQAASRRIGFQAVLTSIIIFLAFASVDGILWIGAREVAKGAMTGGQLLQFVMLAVLAASALGSLSEVWGEVQRAAGASERLMELLHTPNEIHAPSAPEALPAKPKLSIAFDHVTFEYPSRKNVSVLRDFSLSIAPGEKVALVGPSGAGKSTVFQLLLRFYDTQDGAVRIDNIDVREVDPQALRRLYAFVPQETVIFGTSTLDNIRYSRPDASMKAVSAAAAAATADRFITQLPEGYDTPMGERGVTLSGGQRQRISIARALISDAPILLLDEATSALDSESEHLVQNALDTLMEGRTTLMIAHRLSTVLKADRIIVMDEGRIVEEGTHADLVAKGGLYAHLAKLQFTDQRSDNVTPLVRA